MRCRARRLAVPSGLAAALLCGLLAGGPAAGQPVPGPADAAPATALVIADAEALLAEIDAMAGELDATAAGTLARAQAEADPQVRQRLLHSYGELMHERDRMTSLRSGIAAELERLRGLGAAP